MKFLFLIFSVMSGVLVNYAVADTSCETKLWELTSAPAGEEVTQCSITPVTRPPGINYEVKGTVKVKAGDIVGYNKEAGSSGNCNAQGSNSTICKFINPYQKTMGTIIVLCPPGNKGVSWRGEPSGSVWCCGVADPNCKDSKKL